MKVFMKDCSLYSSRGDNNKSVNWVAGSRQIISLAAYPERSPAKLNEGGSTSMHGLAVSDLE